MYSFKKIKIKTQLKSVYTNMLGVELKRQAFLMLRLTSFSSAFLNIFNNLAIFKNHGLLLPISSFLAEEEHFINIEFIVSSASISLI